MRHLLQLTLLSLLILFMASPVKADVCADWNVFKARFLTSDGRIIDRFQDNISHSEGQGYGMIMAALCNDPDSFDSLWQWTRDNLQVRRTDSLLAWSWGERLPDQWTVVDFNNATDGDILVAWGLLLGDRQWPDSTYKSEALKLLASIRKLLSVEYHGHLILLPGYHGFLQSDSIRLNPSYFIFSAFQDFAEADNHDFWSKIYDHSVIILEASLLPPLMLPPDWFSLSMDSEQIHTSINEAVFGFEVIRVPLYLSWAGNISILPELAELLRSFDQAGYIPQRIDLKDGSFSTQSGSAGYYAVFARAAQDLNLSKIAGQWWDMAARKFMDEKDDYYSNILYVLSRLESTSITRDHQP